MPIDRTTFFVLLCLSAPVAAAGQAVAPPTSVVAVPAADSAFFAANEPSPTAKIGKTLHAYKLTGNPPKVDGTLDDEVWTRAQRASGYLQWDPDNMEPVSERTEIQVAYDDRYVYVAIRCFDRTPDAIARGLARRDEFPPTDTISVKFDPRHDHQTGYIFQTNPSGMQTDLFNYDDDRIDQTFDAVWEVRTTIDSEGWIAEFRIPFSQMRFNASPTPGQVWGLTSRRVIRRRGETAEWIGRPRGERGEVSRFGHLVFDEPLTPPRRVELQPYTLARAEHQPAAATAVSGSVGADLRFGIGTSATLSATVNPDFGQVEQDPAVLNLSIFETFFPEKRPFFLEDSRTFVPPYGNFQLFHSRRIGRAPGRIALPPGAVAGERPGETTVLGAAKLTGKGSGWTYGALTALTSREYAHLASGGEALIEPMTSYNIVRVQRDVLRGTSNVGGIFTGVVREKDDDAFTGGVDYNLRWDRNRVTWNGHWAFTRAPAAGAVAPGAGGVATSGGGLTNFNFSRKYYGFSGHYDQFGRDFRVTDAGFFRQRADRHNVNANAWIERPDPGKYLRRYQVGTYIDQSWNGDQLVFGRFFGGYLSAQSLNFWNVSSEVGRQFEVFDDLDTRGGPPILVPARTYAYVSLSSDSRKSWRVSLDTNVGSSEAGGWSFQTGPRLTFQPSGRLQASVSTSFTNANDVPQWITNTDATGDGAIDYVYGDLRRHVVDVTMRGTFSIHRDMTVQLFLQPFVATGDYTNIRRLAEPMSFNFEPVTLAYDPDFNNKSMRSNIVLRWEYLRGSTFYAVWNISKTDAARPGLYQPLRDLGDAFGGDGPNVFMVKISYWLAR